MTTWNTTEIPDADTTVLLRVKDDEYPLQIGYWDGTKYLTADTDWRIDRVTGWMHLDAAAQKLDGGE